MIVTCPACKTANRTPSVPTARIRCGKCKRDFTPAELSKAKPEAPARFNLDIEDDAPQVTCKCGWEGTIDELDMDDHDRYRCPDCDKRVRLPEEE